MNSCLIHSDNTSLLELDQFARSDIYFKIPKNEDVDIYMSELIRDELNPLKPNVIFIKYALDHEYLSFWGLRLAHHIRLSREFPSICDLPIVFVGEESIGELIKIADLYHILSTPGIYYVSEDLLKVQTILTNFEKKALPGLRDFNSYLEKIHISPPANYGTRHSFENKLAIKTWSKALGIELPSSTIDHNIYFKYRLQEMTRSISSDDSFKLPNISSKAKVLLIEDEFEKGWDTLYKTLFSESKGITFNSLASEFKTFESIISDFKKIYAKIDPDIILLDLRLTENDTHESNIEEITGYKLIKTIKSMNPGTQVIITTASNKASSYQATITSGADYFIEKNSRSIDKIDELVDSISDAAKEARFLKPFIRSLKNLRKNIRFKRINKDQDEYDFLIEQLNFYSELAIDTAKNKTIVDRFSLSLVYLYNILEKITDYYLEHHQKGTYKFRNGKPTFKFNITDKGFKQTQSYKHLSEKQKFYNLYYYLNKEIDLEISKGINTLFSYRNNFLHGVLPDNFKLLEELYASGDSRVFQSKFKYYYSSVLDFINALRLPETKY